VYGVVGAGAGGVAAGRGPVVGVASPMAAERPAAI
jgi:hypothetical protein